MMNETVFFAFKVFLSSMVIAGTSWLAGKKPLLAGFLIALPLMSLLTIAFSYWQYRDMEKINAYAVSIFSAVPLSLLFFMPLFYSYVVFSSEGMKEMVFSPEVLLRTETL